MSGRSGGARGLGRNPGPMRSAPLAAARPTPSRPLLRIEGLSLRFGGIVALDNVSFAVAPGGRYPALAGERAVRRQRAGVMPMRCLNARWKAASDW